MNDTNKPSPHPELIITWAKGAEIQIYNDLDWTWDDVQSVYIANKGE